MKKWMILCFGSIVIILGVVLIILLSNSANLFQKDYPVSIESTSFSPEGDRIKLDMTSAAATKNSLTLTLTISGITLGEDPADFDRLVCDPFIATKENVGITFKSREVSQGEPMQVIYIYELQGNTYRTLNVNMDWTIGSCSTALNESNVTPVQEPLLTNYHFTFAVPVK